MLRSPPLRSALLHSLPTPPRRGAFLPSTPSNCAWEPIRSKLESYVGGVSSAKRKDETIIGQASGKIAPENPEITATATPPSKDTCLTKQYLETGAVLFKDTCTRQWAINSTAVATHKPTRRTCLRKEVSDDGIVIFRDTCTNEWAMNNSQHPTDPPP